MAKSRKPCAARKPPVPSDSHADIEDWIRRVMPDLHPIVKRLDELICETIPGLQYAVKWKQAYYGLPEQRVDHRDGRLRRLRECRLPRRRGIRPSAAAWDHGRSRYVKLTTLEEAQGPEMHKWIEQAGRVPGWK